MPMIDVTASNETANDARVRANVLRLAAAQALTGANGSVIFATGSIIGATLAPSISLATLPPSLYVLGMAGGRLQDRHHAGHADRPARRLRRPARLVLAVLLRDLPRRALWRGGTILSFRR